MCWTEGVCVEPGGSPRNHIVVIDGAISIDFYRHVIKIIAVAGRLNSPCRLVHFTFKADITRFY